MNNIFQILGRELDILEPKSPDEIYKTWYESGRERAFAYDSAKGNLAASFASAFVHAGFCIDKIITNKEKPWVFKNKVFSLNFISFFFCPHIKI